MKTAKKISLLLLLGFLIVLLSSCDSSDLKDTALGKTFYWFFCEFTPDYWGFLDHFFTGSTIGFVLGVVIAIIMAVLYVAFVVIFVAVYLVLIVLLIVVVIIGAILALILAT